MWKGGGNVSKRGGAERIGGQRIGEGDGLKRVKVQCGQDLIKNDARLISNINTKSDVKQTT